MNQFSVTSARLRSTRTLPEAVRIGEPVANPENALKGTPTDRLPCSEFVPTVAVTKPALLRGGVFLQWLERPRSSILGLMRVIEADPRHSELVTLSQSEEERERVFGDWDLELVAPMLQRLDQGPLRTLVGA